EWVSTLPLWRRLLAMVNWRPVFDIEQRTRQLENEIAQLDTEIAQLDTEIAQIKTENKRLAALELRMDVLLRNADSSSQTPPATGSS
ncbi:MAG: hypothetical protein WCF98_07465, partial [Synechococcus sp. ELA057]